MVTGARHAYGQQPRSPRRKPFPVAVTRQQGQGGKQEPTGKMVWYASTLTKMPAAHVPNRPEDEKSAAANTEINRGEQSTRLATLALQGLPPYLGCRELQQAGPSCLQIPAHGVWDGGGTLMRGLYALPLDSGQFEKCGCTWPRVAATLRSAPPATTNPRAPEAAKAGQARETKGGGVVRVWATIRPSPARANRAGGQLQFSGCPTDRGAVAPSSTPSHTKGSPTCQGSSVIETNQGPASHLLHLGARCVHPPNMTANTKPANRWAGKHTPCSASSSESSTSAASTACRTRCSTWK